VHNLARAGTKAMLRPKLSRAKTATMNPKSAKESLTQFAASGFPFCKKKMMNVSQ